MKAAFPASAPRPLHVLGSPWAPDAKTTQSKKEEKTVRGRMKNILVLQGLLPEDSSASEITTKVSHLCVLDLNGELGDSLNLNYLKSAMSTINEMQDFFLAPDVRNNRRIRSESIDDSEDFDGVGGDAKLDGFQLLLKDAENMLDQVTNRDAEKRGEGDGAQDEVPDQTYKYGAFVMWMLKNHPDEVSPLSSATSEASCRRIRSEEERSEESRRQGAEKAKYLQRRGASRG